MQLNPRGERRRRRALTLCLLAFVSALALVVPTPAEAGGFFLLPHGARTLGRGGAGAVGVHDLNALWYNPALLGGVEGNLLMLDATLVGQSVTFSRAPRTLDNGDVITYQPVDNEASALPVPQLGFATDLGQPDLRLALGAFAPNAAASKYPVKGPQRYTIIDTEGSTLLTVELAAAYRLTDWLWVGAGFQNVIVNLRLVNMVSGYPGAVGDPEDGDFDILLQTELAAVFNPSGNLGVFVGKPEGIQFGLSAQLPVQIKDDEAKVTQRLPDHVLFDQAEIKGDTVAGEFDFPWIVRAGVRWAAPRWDVELNLVYEGWSTLDKIRTTPDNIEVENVPGVGTIPVGALSINRDFQDLFSLRLGGDFEVVPEVLTLRAGAAVEQSAIPTKTLSVLQVDANKLALGLGATIVAADGVEIDVGYGHIFYETTEVTDSAVLQLNPTNPKGAIAVGNGTYEASADLFGLGVRYGF